MWHETLLKAVGPAGELSDAVLDSLHDGVYVVDRRRRILYWNKAAERISGFSAEEVVGHLCADRILEHCDEEGSVLCGRSCPLAETMGDGERREAHVYMHHKDGHRWPVRVCAAPLRGADGEVVGAIESFHDDSALLDSRRRAAELYATSMRDALTGVGNRRFGDLMLRTWIRQYRRSERPFGVLLVDVDDFKTINDRYGHADGDRVLRALARTLAAASRRDDEVARVGGDEFIVLLSDASAVTLGEIAERLRVLLGRSQPRLRGSRMPLRVSIGGALPRPGDSAEALLRRADEMLYASKAGGGDHVAIAH